MVINHKEPSKNDTRSKIISLLVVALIFITFWYMLDIVLLTFISTFVFYHLIAAIKRRLDTTAGGRKIPENLLIIVVYVLVLLLLTLLASAFAPSVALQLTDLGKMLVTFDFNQLAQSFGEQIYTLFSYVDFNKYIAEAGMLVASEATKIGGFGVNVLLALLLSLLLLLEKKEIAAFGERFEESKVAFIYEYFVYFGTSFVRTFGQVMKVQVTIAFINALVSGVFLKLFGFPQVLALTFMVFFLGLIPVAGVIISLIPLTIIGFNFGGISKVIAVLLMIIVVHALEAYVLNPKLMSNKTHLPVCFVFIILLVSEHYLGVWGLLIGVPIFMFLLEMSGVNYKGGAEKGSNGGKKQSIEAEAKSPSK